MPLNPPQPRDISICLTTLLRVAVVCSGVHR